MAQFGNIFLVFPAFFGDTSAGISKHCSAEALRDNVKMFTARTMCVFKSF